MESKVWSLPGPHRFVVDIADDLREGRNVLVILPECVPRGLYSSVSQELEKVDLGPLERISAKMISRSSPVYDLHQVYNTEAHDEDKRDIPSLCRCDNFKSRMIWLEDCVEVEEKTDSWLEFFKGYACACASFDLLERTVFAVPIRGTFPFRDLPLENLLCQHWFWGRVSSLDIQILAAQILADRKSEALENLLHVNIAASLCGYDIASAEAFCRHAFKGESSVESVLETIATTRGWEAADAICISKEIDMFNGNTGLTIGDRPRPGLFPLWAEGMLDLVDGRVVTSPVAEAIRGNYEEIRMRTWRGHVQTLLPLIDEYRLRVLRHLETNYRFVFKNGKNNLEISEIGAIKYRIETDPRLRNRIDKDLRGFIRLLTNMRNDLSHLRPVSKERRDRMTEVVKILF